ncbi:MAG: zinc-ribbon domain-containing protein, partial [Candidatus Lutacidiplasmatales archaeon]
MSSPFCSRCGSPLPLGSQFCPNCGNRLASPAPDPLTPGSPASAART